MNWLQRLLFPPDVLLYADDGALELARSFGVGVRCFVRTRRGYLVELCDDSEVNCGDYADVSRWEALK